MRSLTKATKIEESDKNRMLQWRPGQISEQHEAATEDGPIGQEQMTAPPLAGQRLAPLEDDLGVHGVQ